LIDELIDDPVSRVDLRLLRGIWGLVWGIMPSARVLIWVGFTKNLTIWHKWRGGTGIQPFGVAIIEKIVAVGTRLHL